MKFQMRVLITGLCLAASVQLANAQYRVVYARPWSPPDSHQGLFVSFGAGLGGMNYTEEDPANTLKLSGGAANFDFKLGGAIIPNLILSGDLISADVSDPDVSANGVDRGRNYDYVSMHALGVGLTYYLMPANVYFSGTLGSSIFDYNEDTSDNGLAVQLQVGKEWWVSRAWGLGLALDYTAMRASWGGNDNARASYLGVMFSATFN